MSSVDLEESLKVLPNLYRSNSKSRRITSRCEETSNTVNNIESLFQHISQNNHILDVHIDGHKPFLKVSVLEVCMAFWVRYISLNIYVFCSVQGERALFIESHRNCFSWIDEWFGMTMQEVRELEQQNNLVVKVRQSYEW